MPAIGRPDTYAAQGTHPTDWGLIWILVVVASILLFETVLAVAWIRIQNLRSKAHWRRLRQRGIVIVDGPALVWADDLPPQRGISYFNLGQTLQASKVKVSCDPA
jgi:hypothetical protein